VTSLLVVLLLVSAADLETLLEQERYREAVAQAASPDALLKATLAVKKRACAAGVVEEVVRLRGVLRDAGSAADWLVRLSRHGPIRDVALTSAGYLYLTANQPERAVKILEQGVRAKKTGLGLTYLGDAYRRTGALDKALETLVKAAAQEDAPQRYLQDTALSLGTRLRAARDDRYAGLLEAVGLRLKAALWLKEDAFYETSPAKARALRKSALAAFRKGLAGRDAPATAFWEGAALADGDERFDWLVEAVRRGRTAGAHAVPGALLDLARECAARKRYIAALFLAQQRLRIGPCPAAWEVIESLPPGTRAPA
jgi:tetratricopeptide (TPR) repeat protein